MSRAGIEPGDAVGASAEVEGYETPLGDSLLGQGKRPAPPLKLGQGVGEVLGYRRGADEETQDLVVVRG
ncbi:MAG: hypothetical protein WB239_05000 [Acidimicrobiia bacterium]